MGEDQGGTTAAPASTSIVGGVAPSTATGGGGGGGASSPAMLLLAHQLQQHGSGDVQSVATIVSSFPAERDSMMRLLHTQLGNSYVQSVLAAMGAAPGAGKAAASPEVAAASATGGQATTPNVPAPDVDGAVQLISTPNPEGHPDFVAAIHNAKHSVFMEMYHLTDSKVTDELIAAHGRGVDVKVILDKVSIDTDKGYAASFQKMQAAGVPVRESSAGCSIQHVKSLVVDGHTSLVTSINLTNNADATRDFGLILQDQKIADEILSVFNADWANALTGKTDTPALTNPNLVWSPNDSEAKLSNLVDRATKTVVATVENLDDAAIQAAMTRAVGRGCHVRLIIPEVDEGPNKDYPNLKKLMAGGVDARVMPYPASAAHPYMHSKMILIDGGLPTAEVYSGSVNFSTNSTQKARELGIILPRPDVIATVSSTFETDWAVSITPPATEPTPTPAPKPSPTKAPTKPVAHTAAGFEPGS